jgi:hypothetical protein
MKRMGWLVLGSLVAASCSGQGVVLNERVFDAKTMELKASGCTRFELGGSSSGSSGGGVGAALVIQQRDVGDRVVVTVEEAGKILVQREYDHAFFEAQRLDEFTATSASGAESLLLRYWGALDEKGSPGCAPPADPGPANE